MAEYKGRAWRLGGSFVWRLTVSVMKHDIASLAATIAFYAFFSLFPLLLLILYATSRMLPDSNIEQFLLALVRPYFPALPEAKRLIADNLAHLSSVGAKIGVVSAVILTWSAGSGFLAVQQAMDVIWESPRQRSFVVRRLIAFISLVVLLLLTLLSSIVMAVYPMMHHLPWVPTQVWNWLAVAHGVSRILFPLSLFLGCLIFYRFLPSITPPWWVLVPGALVATVALDKGRQMFVWYAGHLVTYQMIYGGLAAVMLLVLWMYIASIVMLFGAEVSATLRAMWPAGPTR